MSTIETFKKHMAEAVIKHFNGADFYLIMETLPKALNNHLNSILDDYDADNNIARELISDVWHVTYLMSLYSELYHWYVLDKKLSKTEQQ